VRRGVVVFAACAAVAAACHDDSAAPSVPQRSCALTVWYHPASSADQVAVVGSWDEWATPGTILPASRSDGWRVAQFNLPPGEAMYSIVDDGTAIPDPSVGTTAYHAGKEVTWVDVASCDAPALEISAVAGSNDGHATVSASFLASSAGDALDPSTVVLSTLAGDVQSVDTKTVTASNGSIALAVSGLAVGKHAFTLTAGDAKGRMADPVRLSVWIEPTPFDWRDAVIYEIMVDRYRDANGNALTEPAVASNRAGGQIAGVTSAINSGAFAALGMNTLWLTPLYANAVGTFPGSDGKQYSSYHGYWPIAPRAIEPALGAEGDVDTLIAAAHAHGIRVLFDVVPNHVHQQHPYWAQHESDGWFNHPDGTCICGSATCSWETDIVDCWFTDYMPDLDWTNPVVADQITSDVAWWVDRFDSDGVRIDAVPMMPRSAARRIAYAIRSRFAHPASATFLLGENYVGPGGYDLLRYDLGPFGLDSEFHFPLMWALRGAYGDGSATLADVESAITAGEADWEGSGAVMGLILGNHDVARFVTVANGDGNGDPWTPAAQPTEALVYAEQRAAFAITYALPGAPVVYYGDEVALAGHDDPDSRRVMPDDSVLNTFQVETRAWVETLGKTRACSDALRRGTYRTITVDDEHLVFARESATETALVVAQRATSSAATTTLTGIADGSWVDALGSAPITVTGGSATIPSSPDSVAIYFPAVSACSTP
jgi:glycosidase